MTGINRAQSSLVRLSPRERELAGKYGGGSISAGLRRALWFLEITGAAYEDPDHWLEAKEQEALNRQGKRKIDRSLHSDPSQPF